MFPLFQNHLDLAHQYWTKLVKPGDIAIDATCGNGYDTLILAQLCLTAHSGTVLAIDISPKAIKLTRQLLESRLAPEIIQRVDFIQKCHSTFPEIIQTQSVKLITYNLGYLPGGGDKTQTTKVETTLQSIKNGLSLIVDGGAISITCYPGHLEGEKEENQILSFVSSLDARQWHCCHHRWLNRQKAPSLLLIQKLSPNSSLITH